MAMKHVRLKKLQSELKRLQFFLNKKTRSKVDRCLSHDVGESKLQ